MLRHACHFVGRCCLYSERARVLELPMRVAARMIRQTPLCRRYVEEALKATANGGGPAAIAISFDCDLREDVAVYGWLLRELERRGLTASFACIGAYVERFPDAHRAIVAGHHEIVNHTYSHPCHQELSPSRRFKDLTRDELSFEITHAHECYARVLGVQPVGFRAPHFGALHTAKVYPILAACGYSYSSSTIATRTAGLGKPFRRAGILEIPVTACPRSPFGAFETYWLYRGRAQRYRDAEDYVGVLRQLVQATLIHRALLCLYFDPCDLRSMGDHGLRVLDVLAGAAERSLVGPFRDLLKRWNGR